MKMKKLKNKGIRLGTLIEIALLIAVLLVMLLPGGVVITPIGIPSLDSGVVLASPAEYLLNPSFTGGITNWTLSTTTYDPSVFEDSAGSIKTETGVGKAQTATGTCNQTIATSINSTDIVKLSLYWQKGHAGGTPARQDLKAQIALPSAPETWIDIWSDTQIVDTGWTAVTDVDVSEYFTETGTYQFRYYMDLVSGNPPTSQAWAWIDNTHLDVTPPPDISNTPSEWNFGTVDSNSEYTTGITYQAGVSGFRITNNVAYDVNITISASDMGSGWLLADSGDPDATHYTLWAGTELTSGLYNIQVTSGGVPLITVLASSTRDWGLKLMTPTSFADGGQKSGTVTLTATQP